MASRQAIAAAALLALNVSWAGCAAARPPGNSAPDSSARPGRTVRQTLQRATVLLQRYDCATFAVRFLNPIKLAQIADLDAYRRQRQCSPTNRGNVDEILMALRLAIGAEPEIRGVKATIDLSGIGIRISKFEFIKYVDGLWYFNDL